MRLKTAGSGLACISLLALLTPVSMQAAKLFTIAQTYPSGGLTAVSIVVADMNLDGKPDMIVANVCLPNNCHGGISVFLGNSDGSFQPAKVFDSGVVFASSVAVADVNHDGKPDAVVAHGFFCSPDPCIGLISVMLGAGDGTLGAPHPLSSGGYGAENVVIADVNGDHKPDLLVANQCADPDPCNAGGAVGVLLGNGDGTFGATQSYSGGGADGMLALADTNQDGKLDLLLLHGRLDILLGNGDGTFQAASTYVGESEPGPLSVAVGDVNGDGQVDLLASVRCFAVDCQPSVGAVVVFLGNGDGTFQAEQKYSTGAALAQSLAIADVNGDGKPDLLTGHYTGAVGVLLGNGDGTFKTALRYSAHGADTDAIAMADINGDHRPDLLAANRCTTRMECPIGSVSVLLGLAPVQTTTHLSSNLNPSIYGQRVTLTAIVDSVGLSAPTGSVTFHNGSIGLGSATLNGGVALLTKASLPAGTLSITATYNGDSESAESTSAPMSQIVRQAVTATTIKSSLNPSAEGQAVTFTAKVTSPTTRVTGTVTFTAGATTLGTVSIVGGKAAFTTGTLPKGINQIKAIYDGTPNIIGSTASMTQTVN